MNITNNKIDKVFGQFAYEAAIFTCLLLVTLFIYTFHIREFNSFDIVDVLLLAMCVFLIILGLFLGFSTICTQIDFAKKRVKVYTKLFGIIPVGGKWIYVTPDMKLRLKNQRKRVLYNRSQHLYGRHPASRVVEPPESRIILYDKTEKEIAHIKKFKNAKKAKEGLERLSDLLELRMV